MTKVSIFLLLPFGTPVSVPLPLFDSNRGGILESNPHLDKAAEEQRGS